MMVVHSRRHVVARLALWLLTCVGTIGCLTPYPRVVPPQVVAGITTTHVDANFSQEKVRVLFTHVGSDGEGLVVKAIAGGMNSSAKEESENRAKQFPGVDVRSAFWSALLPVVKEMAWLKSEPPQQGNEPWPDDLQQNRCWAPTIAHGSNLLLRGAYSISQDARFFQIGASARFCVLGQADPLSTESAVLQAANSTSYLSAGMGPDEGDPAIKLWTADGGAAYQKAVAEGIAETAKMFRYFLQEMGGNPAKPIRRASIKVDISHARGAFGVASPRLSMDVAIFEETKERILFQQVSDGIFKGFFFSVSAPEVEFVKP